MKLWDKGLPNNKRIESFTVGRDREFDTWMAEYDVLGSIAHIQMLEEIKLLTPTELHDLKHQLIQIFYDIQAGNFVIEDNVEDVHSQVEVLLTKSLGDSGKKIHSGRSRNDQVLLDIKLYIRAQIEMVSQKAGKLFKTMLLLSEQYKNVLMPGYTHFQVAMPSSFGLWLSSFAESLTDDLYLLHASYRITNQNPLGSAAGYGSSFPLNRQLTTDLLGFDNMNYNSIYAQMGRGKVEKTVAFALSGFASTLNKMAMDITMYINQNYGFFTFPSEFTTGSSIMPKKKNPDVFELIRAKCNQIIALPNEIALITTNLPAGYHRDLQIIKEHFFPAFDLMMDCFDLADLLLQNIIVKENILDDSKYLYLFSVEEVNKLVLTGMPFRDAYKKVGMDIEQGKFKPTTDINHTHEGSIGNLCLDKIEMKWNDTLAMFNFEKTHAAYQNLLKLNRSID